MMDGRALQQGGSGASAMQVLSPGRRALKSRDVAPAKQRMGVGDLRYVNCEMVRKHVIRL